MYSYEDRVRAVELYLKLGKRIKATIRQLGYPTKNSLKAWCEKFEKSGDLQKEYVRVRPKYSEEQKNLGNRALRQSRALLQLHAEGFRLSLSPDTDGVGSRALS